MSGRVWALLGDAMQENQLLRGEIKALNEAVFDLSESVLALTKRANVQRTQLQRLETAIKEDMLTIKGADDGA